MPSTTTTKLSLPYMAAGQAQKHVTYNEALTLLDTLVQLVIVDRDLATPPAAPIEGQCYIIAPGATGLWTGKTGYVAVSQDGSWNLIEPRVGFVAWLVDEGLQLRWSGTGWVSVENPMPESTAKLGINATPSTTNRLSVAADATLLNHAGTSHRLTLNKANTAATASVLFQTGFSGRAEIVIHPH